MVRRLEYDYYKFKRENTESKRIYLMVKFWQLPKEWRDKKLEAAEE